MKPLSFVIITYNRPADTLELLQNIAALEGAGELLEDVVVVNNASTSDYTAVRQFIEAESTIPFVFAEAPSNLGVTKGRNFALDFAKGGIVIFLDDDAVMGNADALRNIVRSFTTPGVYGRPIGIVSFKVVYYETGEMQVNGLPHKHYRSYKDKQEFFTYYFAGGAHAIRRQLLEEVGRLPEDFFYGMEEYDLSYRILEKGYCIKYDASIVMRHKESPLGRKPKSEKLKMMWVNKARVAFRYLPFRYYISTSLMWSLQYLKETGFN
ncbi:MAG TPA: glycosyltransferase family 2 protein, partial [Chitinophagaceae bacterium]